MEKQSKEARYSTLVNDFKNYSFVDNGNEGLLNPYEIKLPISNEWRKHNRINPWELWHGNLDAEIMFIGQDFSDEKYFIENFTSNWEKERQS